MRLRLSRWWTPRLRRRQALILPATPLSPIGIRFNARPLEPGPKSASPDHREKIGEGG